MRHNRLFKRVAAIALAAATAASVTACGGSSSDTTTAAEKDTEAAESGDTEAEETTEADPFENHIEVTVFGQGPQDDGVDNWSNTKFFQEYGEATNIDYVWTSPVYGNEQTEFDLMLSGGEYYDLYWSSFGVYPDGYDAGVEDGVYADLTDYVEKYMPNYWAILNSDPEITRAGYTEDGRIVNILAIPYNLNEDAIEEQPESGGISVRGQWLEELGMDTPTTYDELEAFLLAAKDKYGLSQAIYYPGQGYFTYLEFSAGFGATHTFQYQEDGKTVEYGPMTEGWKNYLKEMRDWYNEGIINSEYVSNDVNGWDMAGLMSGDTACAFALFTFYDMYNGVDPDFNLTGIQPLTVNEGEVAKSGQESTYSARFQVSAQFAENEDNLIQLLSAIDLLYTQEWIVRGAYGVEGVNYTIEDGKYVSTALMTDGTTYADYSTAHDNECLAQNLQPMKEWSNEYTLTDAQQSMVDAWQTRETGLIISRGVTMNTEENKQYSDVFTDCETYMQEMTNKFIMGIADIDTEWDNYIETLNSMGIQDAIDAEQSAVNRYYGY